MISLTQTLEMHGPLIVAPMGGGPSTPELVAATSNAGALGSLAAAYLTPQQMDDAVARVRSLSARPFAINLFTPMPRLSLSAEQIQNAVEATREFRRELGLSDPELKPPFHPDFDTQFAAVLKTKPRVFSFVFGLLDRAYLKECQKRGIFTIGTATTLDEALALEESGVDAVVAQGVEAGAHRGIFSPEADDPGVGMISLTQACSSKLKIPVIAAGGIMDGAGIFEALKAGAQAATMGTAFLTCPEAGTSKVYRSALLNPQRQPTRLTRAFSGRFARGIENRFLLGMESKASAILPFPAQNAFTRDIRNLAAKRENPEYLSLWAGMGIAKIRQMNAAELVRALFAELEQARSA